VHFSSLLFLIFTGTYWDQYYYGTGGCKRWVVPRISIYLFFGPILVSSTCGRSCLCLNIRHMGWQCSQISNCSLVNYKNHKRYSVTESKNGVNTTTVEYTRTEGSLHRIDNLSFKLNTPASHPEPISAHHATKKNTPKNPSPSRIFSQTWPRLGQRIRADILGTHQGVGKP